MLLEERKDAKHLRVGAKRFLNKGSNVLTVLDECFLGRGRTPNTLETRCPRFLNKGSNVLTVVMNAS